MTERDNINDFNECAAFVLSKLYDNFPVPTTIDCHSLQDADVPERTLTVENYRRAKEQNPEKNNLYVVANVDEIDVILNRYTWTVQFLIREQYIRDLDIERTLLVQNFRGKAPPPPKNSFIFPELVLTAKGLSTLDTVPESINGISPKSRIEKIKAALRNHSAEGIREVISGILCAGALGV